MSRGFYPDTITPGLKLIMQTSSETWSAVIAVSANCVKEKEGQCVCVWGCDRINIVVSVLAGIRLSAHSAVSPLICSLSSDIHTDLQDSNV